MRYALAIDHVIYTRPPDRPGAPDYTLITAARDALGCGNARIVRRDPTGWTVVVRQAGSASEIIHEPTGRRLPRRRRAPHQKYPPLG